MSRWQEMQLARLGGSLAGGSQIAKVARGGATAFAIFFVGSGLTYVSQIVIARLTGATSYGNYTYVLAWMTLLAYVSAFGFDVALLRFVSAYRVQKNFGLMRGIVSYAESWIFRLSEILVVLVLVGVAALRRHIAPELQATFFVSLPLIPILALCWIRCAVLRAHDYVITPLIASLLVRDGILICLALFLGIGLKQHLDAPIVMLTLLIGAGCGLCLASTALRRAWSDTTSEIVISADQKAVWRRAALPLLVIGAVEVLMNRAGVLCLGWMGEIKNAGIFSLAFNFAFLVAIPKAALNTLFAPTVSRLFDRNQHAQLQDLVTKSTLWSLAAAALVGAGLLVLSGNLFAWFGSDFSDGLPALRILVVGQVIIASSGSQLTIMTMTGHERSAAKIILITALFNVVAMAILAHEYDMAGAAVASILSMVLWNGLMGIFIWRNLGILPGLLAIFAQSSKEYRL